MIHSQIKELVRGLYGVKIAERYNKAVLVTTSTFTKGAIDFVKPLKLELDLKDFNNVAEWCKTYGMK
ncbi:restriction endonuclease [Chitinophaga sp. GCM10012297]|uniref:Restriction endonuclease n=1 Tax=Chitinophaga chungangae TaxID=2821488 RepID=A0ABS3YJF7_9BACT|nr:restriction endonuclease [Chitinophaga chungangae]